MRWRCEVWSEVWQHFSSILPCKSTPSSDWEEQSGLHLSSSAWDQRGLCPEDPGTWAECIWHRNKLVKSQLIIIYWVMVYLDNRKTQTIVQQTNMKQNWYQVSSSKISPNAKRRSGWGIRMSVMLLHVVFTRDFVIYFVYGFHSLVDHFIFMRLHHISSYIYFCLLTLFQLRLFSVECTQYNTHWGCLSHFSFPHSFPPPPLTVCYRCTVLCRSYKGLASQLQLN